MTHPVVTNVLTEAPIYYLLMTLLKKLYKMLTLKQNLTYKPQSPGEVKWIDDIFKFLHFYIFWNLVCMSPLQHISVPISPSSNIQQTQAYQVRQHSPRWNRKNSTQPWERRKNRRKSRKWWCGTRSMESSEGRGTKRQDQRRTAKYCCWITFENALIF